jgi:hypothetical protein
MRNRSIGHAPPVFGIDARGRLVRQDPGSPIAVLVGRPPNVPGDPRFRPATKWDFAVGPGAVPADALLRIACGERDPDWAGMTPEVARRELALRARRRGGRVL